ncbi:MAG: hypothetical protein A2Y07_00600 [Planctomycetes bacterium GWF2_50_10]|nr:MAG: hypothetical protein A2Y07_00600 [Planctomycetes bacterium GWF2_50_10]
MLKRLWASVIPQIMRTNSLESDMEPHKYGSVKIFSIRLFTALLVILFSVVLRLVLVSQAGILPTYITFYPAVIIIALFGGFWLGIISTVILALITDFWVISPGQFFAYSRADIVSQVLFLSMGILVSIVCELYLRARLKLSVFQQKQALYENQQRLKHAEAIAHLGSWELDLTTDHLEWSDEVYRIFGLEPQQFAASYEAFLDVVHPDDRAAVDWAYTDSIKNNLGGYEIEHRIIRKSTGEVRIIHEKCTHVRDSSGKIVRSLGISHDITERKLAENAIKSNEKRLAEQTKELESIIALVSHDLRAPLVNVKGFNTFIKSDIERIQVLLADTKFAPEVEKELTEIFQQSLPESVGFIASSADSMDTLVKSLVAVARAGLTVLDPKPLDMNDLVRQIVSSIQIKFKESGAALHIDTLPPCMADKQQVTQIFTNLIDNAVKYLSHDRPGKINISGRVEKDRVIYCVADNGIGIEPENQERIFEIFTRLAQKAHAGGEGMGLTMVKRMVDHNNGQVWIDSQKGIGSKFFVALPMVPQNNC